MKKDNINSLRYGIFIPIALLIISLVTSGLSYSDAKQDITNDLNDAILALAKENGQLWTQQDTIAALRQMHTTTHKPLIYQASDINFRNQILKNEAYYALALVDKKNTASKIGDYKIVSDSIMLVPESATDGLAIQVQGFADCSMAAVFSASDQTLPGILLTLSILSMASMCVWRRKETEMPDAEAATTPQAANPLDGIKLTPMQRQLARMLLDAPDMRVDKSVICATLWGNKSNAEESLYTLIRRTKTALSAANIEIVCNRGDSYELRINH